MDPIPILQTARLRLRAHRAEDFDAYAAMWADPLVVRFIGGTPIPREPAWSRFLRHAGMWAHLGFGYLALEDRATGAFVGEAGFQDLKREIAPSIEGTLEAGWILARPWQGQGLAEEAMRALLGWAKGAHPGRRFTCIIRPDHAASLRVAAKLGFAATARSRYGENEIVVLERS